MRFYYLQYLNENFLRRWSLHLWSQFMGSYCYLQFQSNTIQSHCLLSFFVIFFSLCVSPSPTVRFLALRPRTWSSTYTGQVPSSAKKRNLTGMDWGWCNGKRALLDAALTCAGPFLFRSDCVFFWTTFSTSLSSSSQSLKHPYQSPALQRYRN